MGTIWKDWKRIMSKIDDLSQLLKEVLNEGKDINSSEFPFINITGDIAGKGILWTGVGHSKQFLFIDNPDRFFVSESLDLARNKSISINNITVLSEKELGPTVTKSNLREVGHLKGLIVDGGLSVNQYLFYDANTDRLGLGTDQPNSAMSIVDKNIELVLGASSANVGSIGTFNSANLELVTDNTPRVTVEAGGNITLGNPSQGDTKVTVIGKLGVGVSTIDPRSTLHVNGSLKFNDKLHLSGDQVPTSGVFNEGDIMWNSNPQANKFVGWVCTRAGNPGVWSGFGRIE